MYTRQKKIINILIENYVKNIPVTSFAIALKLHVTNKTVQRDIQGLESELSKYRLSIDSGNDGYRLVVQDKILLDKFLSQLVNENRLNKENILNDKTERIHYLIGLLIFSTKPINAEKIAKELYISRSQLSNDLKEVKEVVGNYNLSIDTKSHNGLSICGNETDKRLCLLREKINIRHYNKQCNLLIDKNKISKVIEETLKNYSKKIPDLTIQNLILHIEVSLARILDNQVIDVENKDNNEEEYAEELVLAEEIYEKLLDKTGFKANKAELVYLATNIRSKTFIGENDLINIQTNENVVMILDRLSQKYGLDFAQKMDLRINLALHIEALLLRAKNNLLLKNIMLSSIKQSMPFSYELAVEAAHALEEIYHIQLNEDEIGYIAVHFNVIMEDSIRHKSERKLHTLLIYDGPLSESYIFKNRFKELFNDYLVSLDCVSSLNLIKVKEQYDFYVTTKEIANELIPSNKTLLITSELNANDIVKIKRKINEIYHKKSIENLFSQSHFFGGIEFKEKSEVLKFMCNIVSQQYLMNENLYAKVMTREKMGSTLFGNGVVLAHPADPFAEETVIVVSVLKEPIEWGNGEASIIFLVNVRRNAKDELVKFYAFIAELISREDLLENIRKNPTYENFINIVQMLQS